MRTLTAMALGGALVYYLDPVSGAQRRSRLQSRVDSLMGLTRRGAEQLGRDDVVQAIDKVQKARGGAASGPVIVTAGQ